MAEGTDVSGGRGATATRLRSTMLGKNSALEAAKGLVGAGVRGERRGRRLQARAMAGGLIGRPNRIVSMRRTAAASERLGTNMLIVSNGEEDSYDSVSKSPGATAGGR